MGRQKRKQNQSQNKNTAQEQKRQQRIEKQDFRKQRNKAKYHGSTEYKRDFEILLQQILPLNLTIRDVKADGNCLFRCFSLQMYGNEDQHGGVRHEICNYVEDNRDNFEPFIEDDMGWEEVIKYKTIKPKEFLTIYEFSIVHQ